MKLNNTNTCISFGSEFFNRIIKCLIYFILAYALVSTIVCLCGVDLYGREFNDHLLVVLFLLCIGVALYYLPMHFMQKRYVIPAGFFASNAIMIYVLCTANTIPVSDYYNITDMALTMSADGYDARELRYDSYGYIFNWQVGIAWLESVLFQIYRPSITLLKVFNLVIINLTLLLTYYTSKFLTNEKSALLSFLLICLFYPMLVSVGQLSNMNIAAPLILCLIILIKKRYFLLAGILIPCISFIRPVGIILAIAVICLLIYNLVNRMIKFQTFVVKVLIFIVPYITTTVAIDSMVMEANLATTPVSRPTLPYFKFYQGLSIKEWNNPIRKIEEFDKDINKYNAWSKAEVIKAYTTTPVKTLGNNFLKMTMLLGMYDWKFAYTYNQIFPEFPTKEVSACVAFGWAQYIFLLLLCLQGYKNYYRRHCVDYVQILFIGMVCVYFFIEAWPDYRYDFYTLMFIFAGCCDLSQTKEKISHIVTIRHRSK